MKRVTRKFFGRQKKSMSSPLPPYGETIRVLVLAPGRKDQPLEGSLIHVIANSGPDQEGTGHEYDALSYCWGDDPATKSILIGETRLNITPNLYDALQHLRSETVSQNIWIDQICINQEDTIERNHQVQQMDTIYAGAREVIAWLGTTTTESRVILGSLRQVDDRALSGLIDENTAFFTQEPQLRGPLWISICVEMRAAVLRHHPNLENADDWSDKLAWDFRTLLQNAWFQRLWIVQESALPRRLFFQAGNDRISWQKLFAVLADADFQAQLSSQQLLWIVNIRILRAAIVGVRYQSLNLGLLVSMFRNQNSKDPRDKVYALVGLAARVSQNVLEGTPNLKVDYSKPVAQVFVDLVVYQVESCQDLRILSECCSGKGRSLPGLPSWTDDWAQSVLKQNCLALKPNANTWEGNYKACGSHKAEAQYIAANEALSITGLDFDVVDDTTIGLPTLNTNGPGLRRQHEIEEHDCNISLSQEWKSLALESTSMDPYGTFEGRMNTLCRTLLCDKYSTPVSSDVIKAFVSVSEGEEVDFSDIVRSKGQSPKTKCLNLKDWLTEFDAEAFHSSKLFRTRRGYLGMSCHHIEKGDKVCILWGGELPFILRESGTLDTAGAIEQEGKTGAQKVVSHKIIGGYCYIYGLAGGEGIEIAEKEGLAPQKIHIV